MKTVYPNFENVISKLWKRYIRTQKHYIRTEIRVDLSGKSWTNEQKSGPFRVNWKIKKNYPLCNRRAFFLKGKGADFKKM